MLNLPLLRAPKHDHHAGTQTVACTALPLASVSWVGLLALMNPGKHWSQICKSLQQMHNEVHAQARWHPHVHISNNKYTQRV